MGFLSRLIGGKQGVTEIIAHGPALTVPKNTVGIAYDARLVARLKEEHQELVSIFTAIKMTATEGRFHRLPELLADLKLAFQAHIMLENIKFYSYVQHHFALDEDTLSFVSEVRREMDSIARSVVKFVNTHTATVPTHETVSLFKTELEQIGVALLCRVQLEENRLYTLYLPRN